MFVPYSIISGVLILVIMSMPAGFIYIPESITEMVGSRTQNGLEYAKRVEIHYQWYDHVCDVIGRKTDRVFDREKIMEEIEFVGNFLSNAYLSGYMDRNLGRLFSSENDMESQLIKDRTMRVLAFLEFIPAKERDEILKEISHIFSEKNITVYQIINALRSLNYYSEELNGYILHYKNISSYDQHF